jgi:hypothetical protein
MKSRFGVLVAVLSVGVLLAPAAAHASAITFVGSDAYGRAATATFDNVGGNLVVTLTNAGLADAAVPTDLLTAVFFDILGAPSLTTVSADICATCSIKNAPSPSTNPAPSGVGGEWAYRQGSTSLGTLTDPAAIAVGGYGLSSTGLGIFGPFDRFPGANLQGPDSPGGPQYGITTASDLTGNDNGGLGVAVIKNQVIFTLGGFAAANPALLVSNVVFLYGTDTNEPWIGSQCINCAGQFNSLATPEPTSLLLLGTGLLAVSRARRRTRQS